MINSQQYFEDTVKANHGDRYSFEKSVFQGSEKLITVTCTKHNHDFSVKALTLLRKTIQNGGNKKDPLVGSCPKCREKYFKEIKKQLFDNLRIIHNNEYDYDEDSYININKPFYAICKTHGRFKINNIQTHQKGGGKCPECFPEPENRIMLIDNKKYYVCDIHKNVLVGKTRNSSQGCPTCNIKKQKEIIELNLINKLKKFSDDYNITLTETLVIFNCKKHLTNTNIQRKNKDKLNTTYICKKCLEEYNNNVIINARILINKKISEIINNEYSNMYKFNGIIDNRNPDKIKVKLYNKLTDKEVLVTADTIINGSLSKNIEIISRKGNCENFLSYKKAKLKMRSLSIKSFREYKKWHKRTSQTKLPSNPHRFYKEWVSYFDFFGTDPDKIKSHGEIRVETYLKKKNINYVWQKKFDHCKNINHLPFDFFLPDYNTIVEFDGIQHHKAVKRFGGEEGLTKTKKHDEIKNNYCKNNNISIIRLTNDDLINNVIEWELDIELSRIKAEINMNN